VLQFHAQSIDRTYTLTWHEPVHQRLSEDNIISYLYFDDALLSNTPKRMPVFGGVFPLLSDNVNPTVTVSEQVWLPLTDEEMALVDVELIKDTLLIDTFIEYTRKVPTFKVTFLPFRKNGNRCEKLVSFHVKGSLNPFFPTKTHKNGTYTDNSILNNDGMYKVSITETGIYKVTYDDFVALGMNVSSLKTNDIAVFGNGGRMLPEYTSTPVADDLQEVAIEVIDNNGNGYFEQSDYLLFYGVGVKNWNYAVDGLGAFYPFIHELNLYSTQTFYFITANKNAGEKKRVQSIASETANAGKTVNAHSFHAVHEQDLVNVTKAGRVWFGEEFNQTTAARSFSFSVPGIIHSERAYIRMRAAAKASSTSSLAVNINGSSLANISIPSSVNGAWSGNKIYSFSPNSENLNVQLTYDKPSNNAVAWLDFIEIHARQTLAQHTAMFSFRNPEIVGAGNIAEYQFDTKGKNTQIWDVTDQHNIKRITTSKDGNILTFRLTADSLREFLAFDGSSFYGVTPIGKMETQNLHAVSDLDFIIITHPDFWEAANALAAFRRSNDNMRVGVFTTTQVYNEFSSGGCDIGAIRNFLKMFHDRETADNMPKNMLLIGKTSYDPRNIEGKNTCFIPNYQGERNLFKEQDCPSADNFFVKLAKGKGAENRGSMDMGLGRFPVYTNSQAMDLVTKSINYASYDDLAASASNAVSNLGNWRNIIAFMADDWDGALHMGNIEAICPQVVAGQPYLNIEKYYADAYKKESSSSGTRYTEVTRAMNNRINKGCLMFTYFGHGGDKGWAEERLLLRTDIYSWKNKYCLPFFYTACCSFAMYDGTEGTSPAEDILLKTDGGAIALITSTRNSSSGYNETFGKRIYKWAFEKNNNRYLTLGEIYANAHATANGDIDMYVLLGDPSATLAHPKYNVVTDSINGVSVSVYNDTIKALQHITISGSITDNNNNLLNNFNGWLYPSVYDKSDSVSTINPNLEPRKFPLQKSIIFKGKTKVENGRFSFSFLTPVDINYEYGLGKISYYATGSQADAKGYTEILIGGMNDTVLDDNRGPDIELYFNDEKFTQGGITNPNPILHAKISDRNGINTAGAGIGHDILAIIDGDIANAIVLNDYFEYNANSFVSGKLSYALSKLENGFHTLTLRAWDVINNMGEASIDFEVVDGKELTITQMMNYPNPFTTSTYFVFEHNQPEALLNIRVQIFSISGTLVKTIIQNQQNTGFRSEPLPWDGRNEYGGKLAAGIYVYKVQVQTSDGHSTEKIGKIAILQ
jgi:hypothetical protein